MLSDRSIFKTNIKPHISQHKNNIINCHHLKYILNMTTRTGRYVLLGYCLINWTDLTEGKNHYTGPPACLLDPWIPGHPRS